MTGRKVDMNFRDMPVELRDRFKKWCDDHDVTMKWAITEFMEMAMRMDLNIKKPVRKKRK